MSDMSDLLGTVIIGGIAYKASENFFGKKATKHTKRKVRKTKKGKRN